jgi:hypothetical protein
MSHLARAALLIILATTSLTLKAFEIKPIEFNGGGNGSAVNSPSLNYRHDDKASTCRPKSYSLNGSQPVHEIITRNAYQQIYGLVLREKTWRSPLLAGVEWNDDPEELIRKAWHYNGMGGIKKFISRVTNSKKETALTRRSHFGDLQFLHAMRPLGSDDASTHDEIMAWIKETYAVAIGEVKASELRKNSFYHKYFAKIGCGNTAAESKVKDCSVLDVFDMKTQFRTHGELDENLRWLATGSIAHIIQDSFSASHTVRNSKTFELISFKTYDTENQVNHCESDGAVYKNMANIERATKETAELLYLIRKKAAWSEAEVFFKKLFDLHPPNKKNRFF